MVVLSTTKAEYIVATKAIKGGIWIQGLLSELNLLHSKATIFSNSQSYVHLCKNPTYHDRTKHIDVKYKFIREKGYQWHSRHKENKYKKKKSC